MPTPKPRKPPAEPKGPGRLTLTINGTSYGVRPVACERSAARRCYELTKRDGTRYHVVSLDHGAECDCGDFVFHRDGKDPHGCKHIRSLVAVGILDTRPAPVRKVRQRGTTRTTLRATTLRATPPSGPRGPMSIGTVRAATRESSRTAGSGASPSKNPKSPKSPKNPK